MSNTVYVDQNDLDQASRKLSVVAILLMDKLGVINGQHLKLSMKRYKEIADDPTMTQGLIIEKDDDVIEVYLR